MLYVLATLREMLPAPWRKRLTAVLHRWQLCHEGLGAPRGSIQCTIAEFGAKQWGKLCELLYMSDAVFSAITLLTDAIDCSNWLVRLSKLGSPLPHYSSKRLRGSSLHPGQLIGLKLAAWAFPGQVYLAEPCFFLSEETQARWEFRLYRFRAHREQRASIPGLSAEIQDSLREQFLASCGKINEPFTNTRWTPPLFLPLSCWWFIILHAKLLNCALLTDAQGLLPVTYSAVT